MIKTCVLCRLLYSTLVNSFADMKSLARMVHGMLPYLLHGSSFLFNKAWLSTIPATQIAKNADERERERERNEVTHKTKMPLLSPTWSWWPLMYDQIRFMVSGREISVTPRNFFRAGETANTRVRALVLAFTADEPAAAGGIILLSFCTFSPPLLDLSLSLSLSVSVLFLANQSLL